MAEVGQTCPQDTQFIWHPLEPMRLFSTGVHRFSNPPANPPGCITFVGHALMHWPHFMHLFRNSSSSRAPGGRIIWWNQFAPVCPPSLKAGMTKIPPASERINPFLETPADVISPVEDDPVW
jgi:hypothetical protein